MINAFKNTKHSTALCYKTASNIMCTQISEEDLMNPITTCKLT
jgi:hypothetical protein